MKRFALAAACCILVFSTLSPAVIYNWQTGEVIPGTESITPAPGVNLSNWNTDPHNLKFASLGNYNLTGSSFASSWLDCAMFGSSNLTSANFSGANLAGARFEGGSLSGANFTNATIAGLGAPYFTYLGTSTFTSTQLYSTASYKNKDLSYIYFSGPSLSNLDLRGQDMTGSWLYRNTLTWTNFSGANLSGASLGSCNVQYANFADATVKGTIFASTTNFTKEQLYSTASYKNKDLGNVDLTYLTMTSWNLSQQNMTSARLARANMTSANLAGANLTGASLYYTNLTSANLTGTNLALADLFGGTLTGAVGTAIRHNTIWTDGTIWIDNSTQGMHLLPGEHLDGGGLTCNGDFTMQEGSTLHKSMFSTNPSSPTDIHGAIDLAGTLELSWGGSFLDGPLNAQEFRLFNWNGNLAAGDCFDSIVTSGFDRWGDAIWDTSRLYTEGIVTVTSIPEPMTLSLLALGLPLLRRRKR